MRARIGRRLIALVLLVAIGTTMTTSVACVLPVMNAAAAEQDGASAHPHAPAHPHASGLQVDTESHPAVPAGGPAHEPNHETDGCGMLMACGLAAPAAQVLDVAFAADPIETRAALIRDAYDSPSLSFEPPPPRS